MEVPYYPINDVEPAIKGLMIGGLGIVHVFLAQFAIGGGFLMAAFQRWSRDGRDPAARRFLDGYFRFLVLVSFVLGAVTGVGMWFVSIQVSPRTIGLMIDAFHWIWALEWTFFCLEIVAGYTFYRYGARLDDRTRLALLVTYSIAGWFSLFWINGILSWQLTPGQWLETGSVWAGFFNPSFWPSLVFRTIVALTLASLTACVVINAMREFDRETRARLITRSARFLAPMALMPLVGAWFLSVIPPDSRSWVLGGSAAMSMFLALAIGVSVLIGGYAIVGLIGQRLMINGATATLLVALAFMATAGGEFVREGVRKPFTVRETLYSNAIASDEIAELRRVGSVAHDPYPVRDGDRYPSPQLVRGRKVYRFQCNVCHSMEGVNGLVHLTRSWSTEQKRLNVAQLQHTKPFMPPFAGNAEDLEALVQLLEWEAAGRPERWPVVDDVPTLTQNHLWLRDAGTERAPLPDRPDEAEPPAGGDAHE